MNNDIYNSPKSNPTQGTQGEATKPGVILKLLLTIFTLLSCIAAYINTTISSGNITVGISGAISPILLGVIIVGIYQIGKRFRNARSRYKIFLYCQIIFFLSSFFNLIAIGKQNIKEPKIYSYISYYAPALDASMTLIKHTRKSECEKWRKKYYQASISQCEGCQVQKNECTEIIPDNFILAFQQKRIGSPYILMPYTSPEIIVLEGYPDSAFMQACNIQKKRMQSTVCIK